MYVCVFDSACENVSMSVGGEGDGEKEGKGNFKNVWVAVYAGVWV